MPNGPHTNGEDAPPTGTLLCKVCGVEAPAPGAVERATVRSNVRRFRDETFGVWRCPSCRSIHAADEVDLDHYYASYPSFPPDLEWRLHPGYRSLLARLVDAGLEKNHAVLDFGCGSGALVRYLRGEGYEKTAGYDAYAEAFRNPSVLEGRYDCIVSQDVIEHVDSPPELLRRFDALAVPSGLVAIGTPDAAAIDLGNPNDFVHALHAPYHRHILSADALRSAAERIGWRTERFYTTMYGNTLLPTQNPRFGLEYLRAHDDCLDLLTEPLRMDSLRFWSPRMAFYAFFGFFFDRHTDVMFAFRTGSGAPPG